MQSIVFEWNSADFAMLVDSCRRGPELPFILKYLPRTKMILEAGCGLARYVAYLADLGFNIEGIEINPETVAAVIRLRPELQVRVGDVTNLPYADESLAGIISLGVIEHFSEGPELPLREMLRVLQPERFAIVTVPSFNLIRRMKMASGYLFLKERIKSNRTLRKWLGKEMRAKKKAEPTLQPFPIYQEKGEFFEYRFSRKAFEDLLHKSGFEVVESVPIAHMDGLYHEFGRPFVSFKNWQFHPNFIGRRLNQCLSRIPFFHNHMHLCVVKKPAASRDDFPAGRHD